MDTPCSGELKDFLGPAAVCPLSAKYGDSCLSPLLVIVGDQDLVTIEHLSFLVMMAVSSKAKRKRIGNTSARAVLNGRARADAETVDEAVASCAEANVNKT